LGLVGVFLRWNLGRFGSFLVRFGFVFFAFFWSVLIVSLYHIMRYGLSVRFKIGFV
jgi:hypothetical protein